MKKQSILPIFVTVFIDLLGVGIVIPILAPLFLSGNLFPVDFALESRLILLGLLIASYPIAQFFGAPILGALSDRHGRKKILMISLFGRFIGYLLMALGVYLDHIYLLFFSRIIDGFTGGNISIALSAMADMSDEKSKAKNFGLIGMAFGLGFILGPFIGGKLADPNLVSWFNYATPYLFAAILTIFNILLVVFMFKETLQTKINSKISLATGFHNIKKAFSMPNLRNMFVVIFLLTLGFNFFTQFFQVFLIEKFQFTQSQIGNLFGYLGFWVAVTQGVVTRYLAKKFTPVQVFSVSALMLSLTLPLLLVPKVPHYLLYIIPFIALFNGLTQPNSTAIVSNLSDKESQGEILGINQSIQSLGMAIPPIIAGFVVALHPSLPIILSSFFIFISWIVFKLFFHKDGSKFHEVE